MWLPSLPPVLETPLIDMFNLTNSSRRHSLRNSDMVPIKSIIVVSALAARRAWRMRNQTQSHTVFREED